MGASQKGDLAIFNQWWRSWFNGTLPAPTHEEHAAMPGMLTPDQITSLTDAPAGEFDALFVRLMTVHHRGAMVMASTAVDHAQDPRVILMAHAILHSQSGEIDLMMVLQACTPSRMLCFRCSG
jgi:uncharacterized protein (DUF305 family)